MPTTTDQARTVALFVSDLQPHQHPGPAEVHRTVAGLLRRYGIRWCAARMAERFATDVAAAVYRLAWVLQVVRDCYGPPAPVPPTRCHATGRSTTEFLLRYGPRAAPRCPFTPDRFRRSRF